MIKVRTVKPKLLDQVWHATLVRHLSFRTEQAYVQVLGCIICRCFSIRA